MLHESDSASIIEQNQQTKRLKNKYQTWNGTGSDWELTQKQKTSIITIIILGVGILGYYSPYFGWEMVGI